MLIEYEKRGEDGKIDMEFTNAIRKAKEMVENSYEIDLKQSGRTGTIFALKNFGWKDQSEVVNTVIQDTLDEEKQGALDSFLSSK